MELRADPNKRIQRQQEILQKKAEEEKKRRQKLFIIYFSAGMSLIALVLIGFVAYKIYYTPTEYQMTATPAVVKQEPPKAEGTSIVVEDKTYENVQAYLDRNLEPPVQTPQSDLPAGNIAE